MEQIKTIDSEGLILCHDMTQIIKDEFKGVRFKKGHVIKKEDIPVLLSMGKDHVYIWKNDKNLVHEDDAAKVLYSLCKNAHMSASEIKEGKIEIRTDRDGLLKIDRERLDAVNDIGDIIIATRHGGFPVKKGDILAAMRVIPLAITQEKLSCAVDIGGKTPILEVVPFKKKKVGIVITGNEIFYGRIEDKFSPVIYEKCNEFPSEIIGKKIVTDDVNAIKEAINNFIEEGAEMVICTGGMSVDPDDTTPAAIKSTGAEVITYGAPVLPGAMFLLAYKDEIPVLGLPGCVMYAKRTIFDLVLPQIMADERIAAKNLSYLGHGGLCLNCVDCHYPNCGFGK
ncbi:MAG: molybdopterin-binding protein [Eubacterium sp.]